MNTTCEDDSSDELDACLAGKMNLTLQVIDLQSQLDTTGALLNEAQLQLDAPEAMVAWLQAELQAMNETCQDNNSTNTSACAAVEAELLVCQEQQFATITQAITQLMAS